MSRMDCVPCCTEYIWENSCWIFCCARRVGVQTIYIWMRGGGVGGRFPTTSPRTIITIIVFAHPHSPVKSQPTLPHLASSGDLCQSMGEPLCASVCRRMRYVRHASAILFYTLSIIRHCVRMPQDRRSPPPA